MTEQLQQRIQSIIETDRIVLFMKGNRAAPQCGFSATVIGILNDVGAEYATHNVLEDPELRAGIKTFSDWQTIPQLYIDGEFQGGCDIVQEMFGKGELHAAVGLEKPKEVVPTVELTASACTALAEAVADAEEPCLRLEIGPRFQHNLFFSERKPGDVDAIVKGDFALPLVVDAVSARRADGLKVDYQDGPAGTGFKLDNPNAPPSVKPITAKELNARINAGESFEIIDVRGDDERALAGLKNGKPFDEDTKARIAKMNKHMAIVFICRTGNRSMVVAQKYLSTGYTNVHNLSGGTNAWSRDVDSSVPTY